MVPLGRNFMDERKRRLPGHSRDGRDLLNQNLALGNQYPSPATADCMIVEALWKQFGKPLSGASSAQRSTCWKTPCALVLTNSGAIRQNHRSGLARAFPGSGTSPITRSSSWIFTYPNQKKGS